MKNSTLKQLAVNMTLSSPRALNRNFEIQKIELDSMDVVIKINNLLMKQKCAIYL